MKHTAAAAMAAASLLFMGACSNVDIVGSCETASDELHLGGGRPLGFGVLDGNILLLNGFPIARSGSPDWRVFAQWFDGEGRPLGERAELGTSEVPYRARFVEHEGALVCQLWVDPTGAVPAPYVDEVIGTWRFFPPPGVRFERTQIDIDVNRGHRCSWCDRAAVGIGSDLNPGRETNLPTAARGTNAVEFWVVGIPPRCGDVGGGTSADYRPFVWNSAQTQATADEWWEVNESCMPAVVSVPALVEVGEGVSAFFRQGGGINGHVHFQSTRDAAPKLVGGTWRHSSLDAGYQIRAATVGDDHILFTERGDDEVNSCHIMRRIDLEGNDSEETPWQTRCNETDAAYTSSVALERLDNGLAALTWGERTSFGPGREFLTVLTRDIDYDEGIYLTMITEDGQRGSEILEVTGPDATVLRSVQRTPTHGPYPAEFYLNTFADGDDVYVLWEDTREDARGIYVRRVTCAEHE